MEALNLWKIYKLGSTRVFLWQNESGLSHETNLAFLTTEKSRAFAHWFLAFELSLAVT